MLNIIVPLHDEHGVARNALDNMVTLACTNLNIIVVDNNSHKEFRYEIPQTRLNHRYTYIYEDRNLGALPAFFKGVNYANDDLVAIMHSDVVIHEQNWDKRVFLEIAKPDVAMVGFFGSPSIDIEGRRVDNQGNMLGKKYGQTSEYHGLRFTGERDVVVLDSLAIFMKQSLFNVVDWADMSPHHWFDRIIPLRYIDAGYKIRLAGIGFDHDDGSIVGQGALEKLAMNWCKSAGIEKDGDSWDETMWRYGKKIFQNDWSNRLGSMIQAAGGMLEIADLRYFSVPGYDWHNWKRLEGYTVEG